MKTYYQTGSVGDVKMPVHAHTARAEENIAAVCNRVAENPSTRFSAFSYIFHYQR